jgi:DNA-binding transcriptional LysR family regulator
MELRHLRYFLAVAEEGHFGRAARRLRIAQPPLSRQVQALEEELGFPLFDRKRRALTPAGETFVRSAREVFDAVDRAVVSARRAARGETGRIRVGFLSSIAISGLAELLRAFRIRSPGVEVALRELPPQHQIDALKAGQIDVGFLRAPLDDPALRAETVRTEELVIALPADHPFAGDKRIALSKLAREPFVSFPRARGPAFFDQLMRLCHDAGFTPHIVQEAAQLDLLNLVAAGFGVAIVPASLRKMRAGGLVFRPIVGAPKTDLLVAWRPDLSSAVVDEFLAAVREASGRRRANATR